MFFLFFEYESGVRHKVSTKSRKKSGALTFLCEFKQNVFEKRQKMKRILFSIFVEQFQHTLQAYTKREPKEPMNLHLKNFLESKEITF